MVVLGGGKQAHMRGGDIRRLSIHSGAIHGEEAHALYLRLADDNPAIGGRAVRIQTVFRGFRQRLKEKRQREKEEKEKQEREERRQKEKEEREKMKEEEDEGKKVQNGEEEKEGGSEGEAKTEGEEKEG